MELTPTACTTRKRIRPEEGRSVRCDGGRENDEGTFMLHKVLVIKAKHVGSCEDTCAEMTCEGTKSTVSLESC
ncbi:hypothetical protein DY000_02023128 [Brassica cretica]|uniref:Uncharacterized protein n=1 Tax=Brassica cretica TaxID=69181 RepID=A0ABQ7EI89_BRACR|nr:hypothetical protein DY000_02023128 [Brassica cretica]